MLRNRSRGIEALAASVMALASTVGVTGAFFALRSASQSVQVCAVTSSGRSTEAMGALARPFLVVALLMVLDGS